MSIHSDVIEAKISQEYYDYVEMVCIEEFSNHLTPGREYKGYLIKKHNSKDGIRLVTKNDQGNKDDHPIRWFRTKEE